MKIIISPTKVILDFPGRYVAIYRLESLDITVSVKLEHELYK